MSLIEIIKWLGNVTITPMRLLLWSIIGLIGYYVVVMAFWTFIVWLSIFFFSHVK